MLCCGNEVNTPFCPQCGKSTSVIDREWKTVAEVARSLGVEPKKLSDLFFQRKLDTSRCQLAGRSRLIPASYVGEIAEVVKRIKSSKVPTGYITLSQASQELQLSRDMLRYWVDSGTVKQPHVIRGERLMFLKTSIEHIRQIIANKSPTYSKRLIKN